MACVCGYYKAFCLNLVISSGFFLHWTLIPTYTVSYFIFKIGSWVNKKDTVNMSQCGSQYFGGV